MSAAAIIASSMILSNQHHLQRYNNSTASGYRPRIESWDQSLFDRISKTYPETAHSLQSQKPELRVHYVNVISDIMWKLGYKRTLSDSELTRTSDKLARLTQAGLKVEWLWSKLERKKRQAYLERKKRDACEARILDLKQELKKLEVAKSGLKAELKNEKAKLNPRSFRSFFCLKT